MRFGWVLNLDAELELSLPPHSYSAPTRLTRQLALYGAGARNLLGEQDVLIAADTFVGGAGAGLVGRAWCPTPRALSLLRKAGVEPEPHPAAAVLRRVNHRLFALQLGGGLTGQRYVSERSELLALPLSEERPWLLKRPLSFSGRGQLRIYASIDAKQWAWIDASLRSDGVIVEPLVQPTLELSLHGFVWRDGAFELGRVCVQEVSDRGVFRGIRCASPAELHAGESALLVAAGARVAEALWAAGYFGPFGIDGYRYRSREGGGFCALGEINARYSMGFVTGFPRHPSELVL